MRLEQAAKPRAKNQLGLPVEGVAAAGREAGDLVHVAADQDRVITAREPSDRRRTYTMSDLLGAAAGLYDSADEIDAEIAAGRIDCSRRPGGDGAAVRAAGDGSRRTLVAPPHPDRPAELRPGGRGQ